MDYPVWDVGIGGGMLIAIVAIAHVVVSHFAIGGGLVLAVTETLSVRRKDRELRELARRGSLLLILISTVFGAISGVGIWVIVGLISPGAISALIHTYVWGWAIEWTFFFVEIVAALVYWATWDRVSKGAHLMVGWIYFVSAYLSLVVINGIITFQLTPGRWLETHAFWDGFFNPTYWPALVLRTGICAIMATVFLLFLVRKAAPDARTRIVRYLALWLVAGGIVAYAGYQWWEGALPETVLGHFRGDSPAVEGLAATRSLTLWALAGVVLLGALLAAVPRAGRTGAAVLVAVCGVLFFGGYERLREGVRKPFLIHSHLFSNGLRLGDIERINEEGMTAFSGWVGLGAGGGAEAHGRQVFRTQCGICHTLDGYQPIRPRLPAVAGILAVASDDPPGSGERVFRAQCASCHAEDYTYEEMKDTVPTREEILEDPESVRELNLTMIESTLEELRDMGQGYVAAGGSETIDTQGTRFPHMPPLVGTRQDLQALAAYLVSLDEWLPPGGGE